MSKKADKHGDWCVVVPVGGRDWIRRYTTEDAANVVRDAYNRRFVRHPYTGEPWGRGLRASVLHKDSLVSFQ